MMCILLDLLVYLSLIAFMIWDFKYVLFFFNLTLYNSRWVVGSKSNWHIKPFIKDILHVSCNWCSTNSNADIVLKKSSSAESVQSLTRTYCQELCVVNEIRNTSDLKERVQTSLRKLTVQLLHLCVRRKLLRWLKHLIRRNHLGIFNWRLIDNNNLVSLLAREPGTCL